MRPMAPRTQTFLLTSKHRYVWHTRNSKNILAIRFFTICFFVVFFFHSLLSYGLLSISISCTYVRLKSWIQLSWGRRCDEIRISILSTCYQREDKTKRKNRKKYFSYKIVLYNFTIFQCNKQEKSSEFKFLSFIYFIYLLLLLLLERLCNWKMECRFKFLTLFASPLLEFFFSFLLVSFVSKQLNASIQLTFGCIWLLSNKQHKYLMLVPMTTMTAMTTNHQRRNLIEHSKKRETKKLIFSLCLVGIGSVRSIDNNILIA